MKRSTAWFLGGVLVAGLSVRLVALDAGLWFDEILTLLNYVQRPLPVILTTFDSQNQHMLYSVLARISYVAFGMEEWAIRLPAVAFGVGGLWAVWWFGRETDWETEGFMAAAFLAFSYQHVWFSQNARGYSGLFFFTLVTTVLFTRLLRHPPQGRTVLWYGLTMAGAVFTHATAVFLAIGHLCVWGVRAVRARRSQAGVEWRPALAVVAAGGVTLLCYAPVLSQMVTTLTAPTLPGVAAEWKNPMWLVAETLRGLAAGIPGGLPVVVVGGLVTGVGAVDMGRRRPELLGLIVLPWVLLAAVLLVTSHNLWPRMFFPAMGFGVLLVARGGLILARAVVPARRVGAVAFGAWSLLVVLSATTLRYAWAPKQDYRGARALVESVRADEDAVVTVDMTSYAFSEYVETDWLRLSGLSALREVERTHRRVWLVYTFPAKLTADQPEVWEHLEQHYDPAHTVWGSVNGGAIVILKKERVET